VEFIGVQLMSRDILKWFGIICGSLLLAALSFFGYFVMNSGRDKDHLLRQAVSPDGKLKAEIHQNITPMHGGPDTLRVTIAPVDAPFGDVVYSRTYECDDHGAFQIQWENSSELTIAYGACSGSGLSANEEFNRENRVWKKDPVWHDVNITYKDTKHVATR
jgi:hypothetical protein